METVLLWLVPTAPLVGFGLIGSGRWPRASGLLAVGSVALASVVAWGLLGLLVGRAPADREIAVSLTWFQVGSLVVPFGLRLDPLAAIMLVVVATVSLLVQVYSLGYMADDRGQRRYFAVMALFTAAMLGLALSVSLVQFFLCWELVGLCSYLLIGHWYERPAAAAAAKKAFLTTRLGDLGLLVGIILLYRESGTFSLAELEQAARVGALGGAALTVATLLLFAGAVGKSAQFPLHVWLPDAMEGPTPVSALIHAATMVAAGVYLVGRTFPLFLAATPDVLALVAGLGAFTALFAATQALVMRDIKRVLAFSTISQLGYMFVGLGLGGLAAGLFHLMTHAVFKALLFLAAGCVIHALHEQDLFRLGGLGRALRWTTGAFALGALALVGLPPLAGFWSKDEILVLAAARGETVLLGVLLITGFLTALYIARAFWLAFGGVRRPAVVAGAAPALHEPPVMTGPLLVLMGLTVLAGLPGAPPLGHWLETFLTGEPPAPAEAGAVPWLATGLSLLGLGLAWRLYRWAEREPLERLGPVYRLLINRYYLDHLYTWLVGRAWLAVAEGCRWVDQRVVDGLVNGLAWLARSGATAGARLQTGQVSTYILAAFAGAIVLWLVLLGGRG